MRFLVLMLVAAVLCPPTSTATEINPAYVAEKAHKLEKKGQFVDAYLMYAAAAAADPDNRKYWAKAQSLRTKAAMAAQVLPAGKSTTSTPTIPVLRPTKDQLDEIRRPQPPVELAGSDALKSFDIRADAKSLFEQIAKAYGLDLVFDGDFQPGPQVRFRLPDAGYREALSVAQAVTGNFIVTIGPKLFMVVKDTQQKRTEQESNIAVSVPIPEPVSVQDTQELARSVQQTFELPKFAIDTAQRVVLVRGPVSKVEPAQAILHDLLRRRPQVYLEVDLLNVDKTSSMDFGISPQTAFNIVADGTRSLTAFGSPFNYLRVGISSIQAVAKATASLNKSEYHTELRTLDNLPVSMHVGDKYPIVAQTLGAVVPPGGGTIGKTFAYNTLPDDGVKPPGRREFGSAYDLNNHLLYIFGGRNEAPLNDLWVYSLDQQVWTEVTTNNTGPSARYGHSLVLDRRGRLIVYGGRGTTLLNDLWAYDPATNLWTVLDDGTNAPGTATPTARFEHGAIYEPVRDLAVITHGCSTGDAKLSDTWAFNFATGGWFQITPLGTIPPPRCNPGAAYVTSTTQMALFGGCEDSTGACPGNDLWLFDFTANAWLPVTATNPPPARESMGFTYEPTRGVLYVVGGKGASTRLDDTWLYDLTTLAWTTVSVDSPGPGVRDGHAIVAGTNYVSKGEFLLFGGETDTAFSDDAFAFEQTSADTSNSTTSTNVVNPVAVPFTPPPQFTFEDLGLSMKATPKVHGKDDLSLEIEVEFKSLAGSGYNGIPIISNRKFATRVRLKFGEAAVVAGLMNSEEATTIGGYAGTGGIPILNALITTNSRTKSKSEALLVIRPRLIDLPPETSFANGIWTGSDSRPRIPM